MLVFKLLLPTLSADPGVGLVYVFLKLKIKYDVKVLMQWWYFDVSV